MRVSTTRCASLQLLALGALLCAPWRGSAEEAKPSIQSIEPTLVARGDVITIAGDHLVREGTRTRVWVDGKETGPVETTADGTVTAPVTTAPERDGEAAGRHERSVVVEVGGLRSDPETIEQLTWGVLRAPRVVGTIVVFLAVVARVMARAGDAALFSKSGRLSLSKMQMALWTLLFGLSYAVLSAAWGRFLDLSEGMFWLMGISATTAVGAKAIVVKNLDAVAKRPRSQASTLLKDWDDAANTYRLSLHRCQIALWTAIVATLFVVRLVQTLHLPAIPDQLLLLMGVSGGAYLGFNYPKTPPAPAPAPAPPAPAGGGGGQA